MEAHHNRYLLIMICFVVAIVGFVISLALGVRDMATLGPLVTAMSLLGPALLDAHVVEKRRLDPHKKSVIDDVAP